MHFVQIAAVAASLAFGSAEAAIRGFNTGNIGLSGSAKTQSDFEAEFSNQQKLVGTDGVFSSARLYTMIQGGTTNDPISAIPAAISTKTGLLLGLWASAGQDDFNNELDALKSALSQYGSSFASLVQGISVGSEDLYRITPTGIENKAGIGAEPDTIISYISQVRDAIKGTSLSGAQVGHVDTWTAWVNGSNSGVIDACDFLGLDAYPYYQTTDTNAIQDGGSLFYAAYDATQGAAGGKTVWVTETGWPSAGPTEGDAVASLSNARSYWEQVYCTLPSSTPVFWYTQSDADQASGVGTFGVVGSNLSPNPIYSLSCKNVAKSSSSSSSASSQSSTKASSGFSTKTSSSSESGSTGSGSSSTGTSSQPARISPTNGGLGAGASTATISGMAASVSAAASPSSTFNSGSKTVKSSLALLAIPAFLAMFA